MLVVLAPRHVAGTVLATCVHGVDGTIGVGARPHTGAITITTAAIFIGLQAFLGMLQLSRQVLNAPSKPTSLFYVNLLSLTKKRERE